MSHFLSRDFFLRSLCLVGLAIFSSAQAQERGGQSAVFVVDATHGRILLSDNADRRLPIGGLTKVATAVVSLDWLEMSGGSRSEMMTVPPSVQLLGKANQLGMGPGDQLTIRDALFLTLLASDNGAALTLADHIGRQIMQQTGGYDPIKAFVGQMNALAAAEGMTKTTFVNPHGLEAMRGPLCLSTAKDLARLALYAKDNTQYNFISGQKSRRVKLYRQGQETAYDLTNQNKILGHKGVWNGKADAMSRAGRSLMTSVHKRDRIEPIAGMEGKRRITYRLVTITLNSPEPFGHTAYLIDQGFAVYDQWIDNGLKVTHPSEMLQDPSRTSVSAR